MYIDLDRITRFSQCPRSDSYYQEDPILTVTGLRQSIIETIIKRCHIEMMRSETKVDWRQIVGWVDAAVFTDIDIKQPESVAAGKTLAEHILKSLQQWFYKVYPQLVYETFVNVRIEEPLDRYTLVCDVPIIQLAEHPTITIVGSKDWSLLRIYNDYKIRGTARAVATTLGDNDITVIYLGVGEKGGLSVTPLSLGKDDHIKTEKALRDLAKNIYAGIDYLSVSSHCQSCPYIGRCKI